MRDRESKRERETGENERETTERERPERETETEETETGKRERPTTVVFRRTLEPLRRLGVAVAWRYLLTQSLYRGAAHRVSYAPCDLTRCVV